MQKIVTQLVGSRRRMAVAFGIGLLLLTLVVGTLLVQRNASSAHPAGPPAESTQAGPYTVTWVVTRLTPPEAQESQVVHLTIRLTDTAKGQPVTDANMELRGLMASMGMTMGPIYPDVQKDGSYNVDLKFSMPGFWRIQVSITRPNTPPAATLIEINANTI